MTVLQLPPDGVPLEKTSDAVDEVNIRKAQLHGSDPVKDKSQFRDYQNACERVRRFYKEQHEKQTFEYNLTARTQFHSKVRARMGIWQAMEMLNTLVDDSDPDTDLSQIQHLLQTAEAIRRDGKPEWMQVVGLVHDLGKLLYFFQSNPEQWSVVGDTFPVGCAFSDKIVYPESFSGNPDFENPQFASTLGVYKENCGLDKVMMSWGHDEYLYLVLKDQCTLPPEGLAMIRYHSFYAWHRDEAYLYLMDEDDHRMLQAVRSFNPYDLYSKADNVPDAELLKPYYENLIERYFPETLDW